MADMYNSLKLREKKADICTQLEALTELAASEERDLNEEETKDFDSLTAKAEALDKDIARAEKFEKIKASLASPANVVPNVQQDGDSEEQPRKFKIPAQCRYQHSSLKAYRGEDGERNAYVSGRFLLATLAGHESSQQWCRDHGIDIRNALATDSNSLGGFLVPEEMERAVINLREEYGVFRREAKVMPMASDTVIIPRRTSGLTGYFVGDNDAITASDKAWDNVSLNARKLAVLCKYSSELAEDAVISIGDDLTDEIAYVFANKEDECGFNGTGTSTYGGINGVLNVAAAGSVYTAATGNTAFSTLDLADLEGMVGKLPQYAEANAKWYISKPGYWASMARLVDAGGGNTIENLGNGPTRMFLGYPVVITQVLNSTLTAQTSTAIAAFGDLRMAAVLGSRRGISVALSKDAYFANDQLAIRGTERFDINIHDKGTATAAGAIIVLKTPAS